MIISLTTDFGDRDAYVGILKAVIAGIAPTAQIIDLCHHIPPQDIRTGALTLWASMDVLMALPVGSVHVVVVDPGVGSQRRPICVEAEGHFFVAPDNGVLWPALSRLHSWKAYHLDKPRWFRQVVSATFHGRDIFSPVAAHLANGVSPTELGSPLPSIVECPLFDGVNAPSLERLEGVIIAFDHFGNAISNIEAHHLQGRTVASISLATQQLSQLSSTFSDVPVGQFVAYIDSFGLLEFAIRNGNAQQTLALQIEQPVSIAFSPPTSQPAELAKS